MNGQDMCNCIMLKFMSNALKFDWHHTSRIFKGSSAFVEFGITLAWGPTPKQYALKLSSDAQVVEHGACGLLDIIYMN